jgi:hypothetical protein
MTDAHDAPSTPAAHREPPVAAHDEHGTGPHGVGDHGDDGGHDDHGHATERLGPIDVAAWGAGALGIVIGLVVVLCFALSTGRLGA